VACWDTAQQRLRLNSRSQTPSQRNYTGIDDHAFCRGRRSGWPERDPVDLPCRDSGATFVYADRDLSFAAWPPSVREIHSVPGVKRLTPAKLVAIVVLVGALIGYAFQVLRPPLPVGVQFRSEIPGSGFVLIFENESDHALSFTATLGHRGQRGERKFAIRVQPRSTYELGSPQGWTGQSGDRISLTSPNYRVWKGAIP